MILLRRILGAVLALAAIGYAVACLKFLKEQPSLWIFGGVFGFGCWLADAPDLQAFASAAAARYKSFREGK